MGKRSIALAWTLAATGLGCAAQQAPVEAASIEAAPSAPAAPATAAPAPEAELPSVPDAAEPAPDDPGSGEDIEPKEPAPAEPESEPRPSQLPTAILTARDVAFMIDYPNSGARQHAEKTCASKAEDPALHAECMTKARDSFLADVLVFKRGERGKARLVTYKRKGSNLSEVHSVNVDFKDEAERAVTMVLKGGDTGMRFLFKGAAHVLVSVPNDYSIELQDPTYGLLRYDAKVGLMGR